jgi:hypothetical protein
LFSLFWFQRAGTLDVSSTAGEDAEMAFRRKKGDWREFLHQHGQELRACGIPEEVFRERLRFLIFLDHGFDQWGWAKNPNNFFNSDLLSNEEIERLSDFVARHFGEQYRAPIATRWMRSH